ncbi:MAG: SGNH/GDSL hydrolase family protein [Candidatus Omnitrophota bacterium]|jgi:lysophospholipase L1-like esterase
MFNSHQPINKLWINLCISGLSIFFFLVILETCVRIFVPKYLWELRNPSADWQLDLALGWVNKPNLDIAFLTDKGAISRFQTNKDGLMPGTTRREREADIVRIMFFGDSTVVGRAIDQNKTVHADLQKILRSKGLNVEVINAGVQGYSTDQVLLRMRQLIPIYKPDIAIYGLCANDFDGNLADIAHGLVKPKFVLDEKNGVVLKPLVKISPQIDDGSQNDWRKWIQCSASYRYFQPNIWVLRVKFEQWLERHDTDEYSLSAESINGVNWQLVIALINEMKLCAESNNASFAFFKHPSIGEVWDSHVKSDHKLNQSHHARHALEQRLVMIAEENSISFCCLVDYFIRNSHRGPFHLLPRDPHCNAAGYELIAEKLADFLINSESLLPEISSPSSKDLSKKNAINEISLLNKDI